MSLVKIIADAVDWAPALGIKGNTGTIVMSELGTYILRFDHVLRETVFEINGVRYPTAVDCLVNDVIFDSTEVGNGMLEVDSNEASLEDAEAMMGLDLLMTNFQNAFVVVSDCWDQLSGSFQIDKRLVAGRFFDNVLTLVCSPILDDSSNGEQDLDLFYSAMHQAWISSRGLKAELLQREIRGISFQPLLI